MRARAGESKLTEYLIPVGEANSGARTAPAYRRFKALDLRPAYQSTEAKEWL